MATGMSTTVRPAGESSDSEARALRESLAAESRRLEKLWDAYKAQESELSQALAAVERLKEDLAGRDDAMLARENRIQSLERDVRRLEAEKGALEGTIREVEALREDLKAIDAYKERVATLEAAYAAERERLAKLYLVYEELEAEVEKLRPAGG